MLRATYYNLINFKFVHIFKIFLGAIKNNNHLFDFNDTNLIYIVKIFILFYLKYSLHFK